MLYNDLALFTSVALHLNYSEAARELNVTPSLVSRRIGILEERLGFRLFERTTRQVRLTAEGQQLLDLCEAPVESLSSALALSKDKAEAVGGTIRITAPVLAAKHVIWPRIQNFLQQYPEISIELVSANDYLDFLRDGIDLAFRLGPLPPSDLIARPLWSVSYQLGASADFKQRYNIESEIGIDQLKQLPAITSNLPWSFEEQPNLQPEQVAHHMADLEVLQQAVRAGMGLGFMPVDMVTDGIETVLVNGLTPKERTMYLVYPSRRLLPQRVKQLVDWFTQ